MSMLFIDVKGLAGINERFGRASGDAALLMIAAVLRETLRGADIPARMRGDDFAVLLPDTEEDELTVVIQRIENELKERMRLRPALFGSTVRISRATIDPSAEDFSLEALIARGAS